jgi:hypothetical protein|tara:strand:- start:51 stop:335 length:285 start_codon:yes stop_codon:yes gene_type:complete
MSENHTNQIKHQPIFMGGGQIWNWEKNFKTLESATEFLLDHINKITPLTEALLRRNKKKEIEKIKLLQTIKTLERSVTTNGKGKNKTKNKTTQI